MALVNKPNTFSANTTASSSQVNSNFDTIYNEFNGSISAANLASDAVTTAKIADENVTTAKLADASVTSDKINFGGAGAGIWWEEIGRTTLSSAGDTITVSSLPAKAYLQIRVSTSATGGTLNNALTFNGDTGNNYAWTIPDLAAGGAQLTSTSTGSVALDSGTPSSSSSPVYVIDVFNNAAGKEKQLIITNQHSAAGAATAPSVTLGFGKWANTSAQISSVTITNAGTGDFAIGSEVVVVGHD